MYWCKCASQFSILNLRKLSWLISLWCSSIHQLSCSFYVLAGVMALHVSCEIGYYDKRDQLCTKCYNFTISHYHHSKVARALVLLHKLPSPSSTMKFNIWKCSYLLAQTVKWWGSKINHLQRPIFVHVRYSLFPYPCQEWAGSKTFSECMCIIGSD